LSALARRNYIAFETIALKEIRRFARIWVQTILPAAVSMGLYLVIFGRLMGPRIGDMAGHSYLDYIMPGVIMMAIINNAYSNVVSSFFGAKLLRHVEEMLVSPIPNWIILVGYVSGGVARGLVVGLAVTTVAMIFTDLRVHDWAVTMCVVVLTAALFSLGGFINAIFAKSFDDISIVPTFVLTPLTYLGGVFYSIHLLPVFWQEASLLNPILYMVNAFRYGLLGVSDVGLASAFAIVSLFIAALFAAALILLNRGVGIRT
jgi:ABC-2 type transport system permease protein